MNKIILIGNLTRNLELKYTSTNKAVLDTNIAVQRQYSNQNGERETDFINIQIWGKQAENLNKYCGKGSKIAIEGELRVDTFEKSDGNKGYKTYVLVNNVEFLDTKKKEEEEKPTIEVNEEVKEDPFEEMNSQVKLDDLELEDSLPF